MGEEEEVPLYDDEWAKNNECETYPDRLVWEEGTQEFVDPYDDE